MKEITLREYLETHTQQEAGAVIGCTQGAIWQMLQNGRDIRFRLDDHGRVIDWYEIRKPRGRKAA